MHLKQIPTEAIAAVKAHPLVIGIAALAVVGGGYYVYQQRSSVATNNGGTVLTRSDPNAGLGATASPSDISGALSNIISNALGATGGGSSSLGATTTNGTIDPSTVATSTPIQTSVPSTTGDSGSTSSYTQQLLDQQTLQINDNFAYQMSQLQLSAAISATNAFLTNAALQSANYGIAAGLAQSFVYSGNQASMGVISGPDGNPLIDFSMINAENSNKNGFDANLATLINGGTFANFWNQTGITPGAMPGTASPASGGSGNTLPNYFAAFLGSGTPITAPAPTAVAAQTSATVTPVAPVAVNTNVLTPNMPTISTPATSSAGFQLPSVAAPSFAGAASGGGGGGGSFDMGKAQQF